MLVLSTELLHFEYSGAQNDAYAKEGKSEKVPCSNKHNFAVGLTHYITYTVF